MDTSTHDGLARANAEVNGEPCRPEGAILSRPGFYSLRCAAAGRRFVVTMATRGDVRRDFTTRFVLQALDASHLTATQTRRYRLVGACPPGWRIGDQAPPGGPPASNALE